MTLRTGAQWALFLAVHILVAWQGWVFPSQPMGDVVLVYEPWSASALTGGTVVGITESWVYPQLALVPMLLAQLLAWPLAPLVGTTGAYLIGWALLVTALDAVAFAVLVGRRPAAPRRAAAWFWIAALLLLGPIALYRIDAVTVPIAVIGALLIARRPAIASALLMVGAWIKIWPGALLAAAVVASHRRVRMLLTALAVAAGAVLVLFLLGADRHLFGFLTEQTGRGLQVEAVAATPFLWFVPTGAASIDYSFDILTFQISAAGADAVSAALTPAMVVVVAALLVLGAVKTARGAVSNRLLPPLALALVVALIVTNKVGSPQFQVWLIAPIVLWFVLDRTRAVVPAAVVLVLCGLTCLIYPLTYDALLRAETLPLLLLTARNALLVVLLVVAVRAVRRVPASSGRN